MPCLRARPLMYNLATAGYPRISWQPLSLPQQQCSTNRLGPSPPEYTWLDHINMNFTLSRHASHQCVLVSQKQSSPHGTHSFTCTRQSRMSDVGDRTYESPTPLSASGRQQREGRTKIGEKDIRNPSSAASV